MAIEVIGSANLDVVMALDRLPGPGETVMALGHARFAGGKGANQAAAAARMGATTRLAAAVGDDADGRYLRDALAQAGVDTDALVIKFAEPTGTAFIAVDRRGENQIVVVPGANAAFTPADLPPQGNARVVLAQGEVPVAAVTAGFARAAGLRLFNPAPADAAMLGAFGLCDVLIVNEHELAAYLGMIGDGGAGAQALLAHEGFAPRQAVVVTLGARGATYITREAQVHIPARAVVPRDTTGAGDCFCGSLAALLDEGLDIAAALHLACAAAALSTLQPGALAAMPTRAQVDAFVRDQTGTSPRI